jgi:signal transduction histidine kinase/CheY-like chemotaxis protein
MAAKVPERLFPFHLNRVFRRGLGRTLLLSFLGLSIVPMAMVGTIGYQMAGRLLVREVSRQIEIAAELKSRQLQAFFDEQAADRRGREITTDPVFSTVPQMLKTPMNLGAGSRAYLVDAGLRRLADSVAPPLSSDRPVIDTDQTRRWRKRMDSGSSRASLPAPFAYAGPDGRQVIGTCAELHLGTTPYALIVEMDRQAALEPLDRLRTTMVTVAILIGAGALVMSAMLAQAIAGPVDDLAQTARMAADGRLDHDLRETAITGTGQLAAAFKGMMGALSALRTKTDAQSRIMSGLSRLHRLIGGEQERGDLCLNILEFLSDFLDLRQANFFIATDAGRLTCISRFPGHPDDRHQPALSREDGQLQRAASDETIIAFRKDPAGGQVKPVPTADAADLIAVPLAFGHAVNGVLELEKADGFLQSDCRFVESAAAVIAVALSAASIREKSAALLKRTREQAEQVQIREAALEANTGELQAQRRAFLVSEEKLQLKQLELEAANAQMVKNAADLEAHMAILEKQKQDIENQNTELEKTHRELEEKARQLEVSSRYKTEFMANMSHELRTPLNSILLLSRLLLENKESTLTRKQSEFARTIHSAGEDLLGLINEILDLAKVESGKLAVDLVPVRVRSIARTMQASFTPLAEQSGITFTVHVAPEVPERLITDRKRIEQIVKNFLSNAFKFTPKGAIRLEIDVSRERVICRGSGGGDDSGCLTICVDDTGIGIPADKHQMVFEAFQQVDGSTRRKYGGTGLGLSISRELARLLGGEITLDSETGRGSRFTLFLPIIPLPDETPAVGRADRHRDGSTPAITPAPPSDETDVPGVADPVPDDRNQLSPEAASVLIIDAGVETTGPIKTHAQRHGFKVLVAEQFQTGLHFADYYLPDAIFTNLQLPGENGWAMVHRIKANPRNRHTPVFTLSPQANDFAAAVHGAAGHVIEPITSSGLDAAFRRIDGLRSIQDRTVLVLSPDPEGDARIVDAVGGRPIHIISTATTAEAETALHSSRVNAVIVDPSIGVAELQRFLTGMQHHPTPVFLFADNLPDAFSHAAVNQYTATVNLHVIDTPDQLLLSLVMRLHLPPDALNDGRRDRLRALDSRQSAFEGRKILLVDDDMRTVFAVSNVLEDQGAEVFAGKTGKESLDKLDGFPEIDLVLMDIMVAEVDGYQAMREIRTRHRTLPIIALTARAMKGDRARCIDAGADDYLAKPVNMDKLKSMLRIWLAPQPADPDPGMVRA